MRPQPYCGTSGTTGGTPRGLGFFVLCCVTLVKSLGLSELQFSSMEVGDGNVCCCEDGQTPIQQGSLTGGVFGLCFGSGLVFHHSF